MAMELTGMEEEGIENLAENKQKKNFIRNISSQTEHKHNIQQKSGVEYVDWPHLVWGFWESGVIKHSVCRNIRDFFHTL